MGDSPARRPHLDRERPSRSAFVAGAGRLGGALARALADAGWEVAAWSRRTKRPALSGVRRLVGTLPERIEADLVLLTVPDRAIASIALLLAESDRLGRGAVVAHCSGALGLEALAPLQGAGVHLGSLHPLASISAPTASLAGYAAAVDGSPKAQRLLRRVARDAGLRPIAVDPAQRGLYHAAASLAANGLVALADVAAELFGEAGLGKEQALDALVPLLASALRGLEERGLPQALTGPVMRGDAAVVEAHLGELRGKAAEAIYRELSLRALSLARAQESAEAEALDRVEALLAKGSRKRPRR